MATSSELMSKKSKYVTCYNNANETARLLNTAAQTLSVIMESQKSAYSIDNESGDGGRLSRIKEKEDKIISYITKEVLPRTKATINSLNTRIEEALEDEKEANEN